MISPPDFQSFQLSTLTQMLSNAAAAESEDSADPQRFLNWKEKACAHLLLPDVEEEK